MTDRVNPPAHLPAGAAVRVGAGELVLLTANQPHAIRARARFKMRLTMIRST